MKQSELVAISRRRFAMAGLSAGAALLAPGTLFSECIQPLSSKATVADVPAIKPGTNTSFAPLKQIDAGLLSVGYAESGPANGPPVILLHGWPYDIYSFVDVTPSRRPATVSSSPTCVAMAPPTSSPVTRSATASNQPLRSTSSHC